MDAWLSDPSPDLHSDSLPARKLNINDQTWPDTRDAACTDSIYIPPRQRCIAARSTHHTLEKHHQNLEYPAHFDSNP